MRKIFFALCKTVNTPVSLGAWLRFEHNQLALAEMEIHPGDYHDPDAFRQDYLVVSFLSKWKGLSTGLDLEAEALRRFTAAEDSCRETNRRIRKSRSEAIESFTAAVIFTAKRKISSLLGPFSLFKIEPWFGWGPGATYEIPRRRAFVDTKMTELPFAVTPAAEELFTSVVGSDHHWSEALPETGLTVVREDSARLSAVPKNAKTHRVIAVEPRANAFLQKGVGGYLRHRLKRVGIDLDDQGPNQAGARRAYTDGLATLDLKAASDTVAIELVYELLPVDWAIFLDDLRTKSMKMPDGSVCRLEKFSSMGNGFTFELESLIFWAVVSSVVDALSPGGEVLIYGDDIICPRETAKQVIECLSFLGFTTNKEKSFIDGCFFESCGKHFFQGKEVTPIYQKETIQSELELLRMGNRLIRYAFRYSGTYHLDEVTGPAWLEAYRSATWSRPFQLPLGTEGDDGWVVRAVDFLTRRQDINFGLSCKVMVFPQKRFPAHESGLLAWTMRRGVVTENPYEGSVTSSPETTLSVPTAGTRWVMPSWEFSLS